jgi:hypothetical protein
VVGSGVAEIVSLETGASVVAVESPCLDLDD